MDQIAADGKPPAGRPYGTSSELVEHQVDDDPGRRNVDPDRPGDPGDPAGQYFITKLEKVKSSALKSARMTYYRSDSKDTTTVSWDLSGASVKSWLYLGLTGNDWPEKEIKPLAWRIELLDANGTLLAEWKSFLWEMP